MSRLPFRLPLLLSLAIACGSAQAGPPRVERDSLLTERVAFTGGLLYSSMNTTLRLDADDGTRGTSVKGEDVLGLPKSEVLGRGELMIRIHARHRVRLGNYFLPSDRSGAEALTAPLQFGNNLFLAGDKVDSELKLRAFAVSYAYSVLKRERAEIGVSLGLDIMELSARGAVRARGLSESEENSGPAPLFGVDATYEFRDHWYGELRAQYLKVNLDNIDGELGQYELNLMYRWRPGITFGAGFLRTSLNVDSTDPGDSGLFKVDNNGAQLFVRVGF
jgi:hypothetical protein